jgi:aspartyl-tRNA(Asn)/glutamyl-tRNA(Gln) amidotransferase subunit A
MNPHHATAAELGRGLRTRQFSSVEVTRFFLDRIHEANAALNAFITVTAERALADAARADAMIARGEGGPLAGVPLAHKDIFCTDGVLTSCGSRMLSNFIAPYDATVVERLSAAGMVLLGKTNMDEFAMGSSNETSHYGPVRNPWDGSKVPGGSSGGSAAAVAARLAPVATGTDTGGSIRQPAALTGLTGLKPTYGRVSRYGMIAFASSLDQAGVLAQSAEDAALVLRAMAGLDARDSTSVDAAVPDYAAGLGRPVKGLRIGIIRAWNPARAPRCAPRSTPSAPWGRSSWTSACRRCRCRCRPTTWWRPPSARRTSRATTGCVSATVAATRRTSWTSTGARAARGSARRSSGGS